MASMQRESNRRWWVTREACGRRVSASWWRRWHPATCHCQDSASLGPTHDQTLRHLTRYQWLNSMSRIAISLFLLWQAPLGVCSAKHRHQSPEWMILSHKDYFIQGEVIGYQVLLDSLHLRGMRACASLQLRPGQLSLLFSLGVKWISPLSRVVIINDDDGEYGLADQCVWWTLSTESVFTKLTEWSLAMATVIVVVLSLLIAKTQWNNVNNPADTPVNDTCTHFVQLVKHGVDCSAVARYAIDSLILESLLFHNPRTQLHDQRHHLQTAMCLTVKTRLRHQNNKSLSQWC